MNKNNLIRIRIIYKNLAKKAGTSMAMRQKEADVEDPLSGSGVLVGSGHSQASHSAEFVDLKFRASSPDVVVGVGAVVVVVASVVVEAVVGVVAAVVVVGVAASVVVATASVVVV